jgi:hypothetical protein
MQPNNSVSDLSSNLPAIGSLSIYTSTVFGNTAFQISPSMTGEVNFGFGTMPYYSLEGQLTMQQIMAATQPQTVLPGQSPGQTNVTGSISVTDASGNVTAQISGGGSSSSTSGS